MGICIDNRKRKYLLKNNENIDIKILENQIINNKNYEERILSFEDSKCNIKSENNNNSELLNSNENIKEDKERLININELEENKNEKESNIIIGKIQITKSLVEKIINSYENVYKEKYSCVWNDNSSIKNEEQIKECEIYINDKKINFSYYYEFPNEGIYIINLKFSKEKY